MTAPLVRATLTLLTGNMLANALPLLLGPVLTRLYPPADFGQYALLWAVATNLGVIACARYEFALPLEKAPHGAALLMALCARLLLVLAWKVNCRRPLLGAWASHSNCAQRSSPM